MSNKKAKTTSTPDRGRRRVIQTAGVAAAAGAASLIGFNPLAFGQSARADQDRLREPADRAAGAVRRRRTSS